jgi:hypothetical protein
VDEKLPWAEDSTLMIPGLVNLVCHLKPLKKLRVESAFCEAKMEALHGGLGNS